MPFGIIVAVKFYIAIFMVCDAIKYSPLESPSNDCEDFS